MGHFILYDTSWESNDNMISVPLQFDCLHYAIPDHIAKHETISNIVEQTITYCRRPRNELRQSLTTTFVNARDQHFTFEQLQLLEVTTEMLLQWNAPIQLIERYQIYVNHYADEISTRSSDIFYNCTQPWFGTRCQYTFDLGVGMSMVDIVNITFEEKYKNNRPHQSNTNLTCYEHLRCNRGPVPMCLDWREICDGKIDCLDGEAADEGMCFDLEINECQGETEFRCHNGLCITKDIYYNGSLESDCLDRSDQIDEPLDTDLCFRDPTFRCEDHMCRPGQRNFVCGDGQCVDELGECDNGRSVLFKQTLMTGWGTSLSESCQLLMNCLTLITDRIDGKLCKTWYKTEKYLNVVKAVKTYCPSQFLFPLMPAVFEHVRFIYSNTLTNLNFNVVLVPIYICYDQRRCDFRPSITILNYTCRQTSQFSSHLANKYTEWNVFLMAVKELFYSCQSIHVLENITSQTQININASLYHCKNSSKVISKYRLVDGRRDCIENDDELFNMSCYLNQTHRIVCPQENKCLSPILHYENCSVYNIDEELKKIPFNKICDGFVHMKPVSINGTIMTDESDCKSYWPCDNMYTRCDGKWTCLNGLDEANCSYSTCPAFEHECISPIDWNMTCLPIGQANDGEIDCLGGTDERAICRRNYSMMTHTFLCENGDKCLRPVDLCDQRDDCRTSRDDEKFCSGKSHGSVCIDDWAENRTKEENFLCNIDRDLTTSTHHFKLHQSINHPIPSMISRNKIFETTIQNRPNDSEWTWRCNRGLYVRQWLGGTNFSHACLCPPSYYGDACQYQNQRVSLALSFLTTNTRAAYIFLIMLIIDDDLSQQIHSSEQVVYVPQNDCRVKFNINFLYNSRPKNISNNYSIRIDAFDRTYTSVTHYASWILPIPFIFLPVNRLVAQIIIPEHNAEKLDNCPLQCGTHGICRRYINTEQFFCLCHHNWTGSKCHVFIDCTNCSSDSKCMGSDEQHSLCVCPINKFGPQCRLSSTACSINTCKNHGTCVPAGSFLHKNPFQCICTEQFYGETCEKKKSRIDISFTQVQIPSHIFAHFIMIYTDAEPKRTIRIKKLALGQNSMILYTSKIFHLLFIETNNNIYLVYSKSIYQQSSMISTSLLPNSRCFFIEELFNSTIMNLYRLQRIKYYHTLCQQRQDLNCFFDETLMCLCTNEHHANCFYFERIKAITCHRYDPCRNDAQCFQDNPTCPPTTICICQGCYYGNRCQFYAERFGLSLEAILSYELQQAISFREQSIVIKLSAIITMLMFTFGIINGLFSVMTFCRKQLREVGCGIYLLSSSITSLFTMFAFVLNFWLLIVVQQNQFHNRVLLFIRCIILDSLLKVFLMMHNWINAFVAIERGFTIYKGVSFNQRKSKQVARCLLLLLLLAAVGTFIHENWYRRLLYDEEEQRTWCVVSYTSSMHRLNLVILLLNFLLPFLINLSSAIFIIISGARQLSIARKNFSFKQHIRKQFHQHRHTIISPIVLVILTLPRLVISFIPGCMKSSTDTWLFLSSYFVSFIPPTLIFLVFVIPSTIYKEEFYLSVGYLRQCIGHR